MQCWVHRYSSDYPEYPCTNYPDQFIELIDTPSGPPQSIASPKDKNLLFYALDGQQWAISDVVPGEVVERRIPIWDVGDAAYDSLALLDNFRWSVDVTTPGAVRSQ